MTAARYDIRSIPTMPVYTTLQTPIGPLLVFQGGRVVEQRVGALPPSEIADLLERQLVVAPA